MRIPRQQEISGGNLSRNRVAERCLFLNLDADKWTKDDYSFTLHNKFNISCMCVWETLHWQIYLALVALFNLQIRLVQSLWEGAYAQQMLNKILPTVKFNNYLQHLSINRQNLLLTAWWYILLPYKLYFKELFSNTLIIIKKKITSKLYIKWGLISKSQDILSGKNIPLGIDLWCFHLLSRDETDDSRTLL